MCTSMARPCGMVEGLKALEAGQTPVRTWLWTRRAERPYLMKCVVSLCLSPESIRTLDPLPSGGYEETFGNPDLKLESCGSAWVSLEDRRLPSGMGKPGAGCLFMVLEAQTLYGSSWALLFCTILGAGILSPKKAELILCVVFWTQIIAFFCLSIQVKHPLGLFSISKRYLFCLFFLSLTCL